MRKFEIYYCEDLTCMKKEFADFVMKVKEEINATPEIITAAKGANVKFFQKLKEITENSENNLYSYNMAVHASKVVPRYMYRKHLFYGGVEYEAEIDLLERRFHLMAV